MPLEITLTGNNKVRLNPQYPVIAGVDENMVPRLIRVDEDGFLAVSVEPPVGGATEAKQDDQITIANETKILIGAVNETPPATDTADSGLNGRLTRLAQRLTDFMAQFPSALGQWNKAGSLSVTVSDDQILDAAVTIADGDDVTQGAQADAAASSDTGEFSFIALFKRLLQKFPASLGQWNSAGSLSVVLADDQIGEIIDQLDLLLQESVIAVHAGASTLVTAQGTAADFAQSLAVARPTRRSILVRNTYTGADPIYVSTGSATVANSMPIFPGEGLSFTSVEEFFVICDIGGAVPWAIADEY